MRLLHASTYKLESFLGKTPPHYAILSHTWGEDEFTFEDLQRGIHQHLDDPSRGLQKILNTCKQAVQDGFEYVWVDTCCIDKTSSAELTEAINSMFKWYKNSAACYVFMEDVTLEVDGTMTNFDTSRWFTRGWTLQELIAPHGVEFFDRDWNHMYSRHKLAKRITEITGVAPYILLRLHIYRPSSPNPRFACAACGNYEGLEMVLSEESIAGKMKWAAGRTTTREEDMAYCLMGLFSINMPLLYGEGKHAFQRLQDEILRNTPDQTMLTWTEPYLRAQSPQRLKPYLPQLPSAFQLAVYNRDTGRLSRNDMVSTPRGLEIDVLLMPCTVTLPHPNKGPDKVYELELAVLSCAIEIDYLSRVAIFVTPLQHNNPAMGYVREHNEALVIIKPDTEPEIVGQLTVFFGGWNGVKNGKVECNVELFEQKRILLPNIQPPRSDLSNTPQLQLEVRSIGSWEFRANSKNYIEKQVLLRQGTALIEQCTVGNLKLMDTLFFSNLETGFFVLWGIRDADPYLPMSPKTRLVCWVECWDSFLDETLSQMAVQDVTYNTLRKAENIYVERFKDTGFQDTWSETFGIGFRARARIMPYKFLGRQSYKLLIEIKNSSNWSMESLFEGLSVSGSKED